MATTEKSFILKQDVLGRITVPKEKREDLLDIFEASGSSAASFARNHSVHPQTFASWIQKRRRNRGDYQKEEVRKRLRMRKNTAPSLNKSDQPAQKSSDKKEVFHLLEIHTEHSPEPQAALEKLESTPVELVLPNGVMIKLSSETQLPLIKTLIKELPC